MKTFIFETKDKIGIMAAIQISSYAKNMRDTYYVQKNGQGRAANLKSFLSLAALGIKKNNKVTVWTAGQGPVKETLLKNIQRIFDVCSKQD